MYAEIDREIWWLKGQIAQVDEFIEESENELRRLNWEKWRGKLRDQLAAQEKHKAEGNRYAKNTGDA